MIVHLVLLANNALTQRVSCFTATTTDSPHLSDQMYGFGHFGKPEGHHFPRAIVLATGIAKGAHRVAKMIQEIRGYVD